MKSIRKMTLAALVAISVAVFSFNTGAQQSTQQSNAQGKTVKGKVSSVDESAQTIVINGKTFQVLPTTRIASNDQQCSINDIKQGEQVTAQYKQSAENNLELLTVEVSPAVGGTSNDATSEAGASFSGKVSKVDPDAKTIVIDHKTYYVLPTTQIKRNDSMANFTDIKAGSQLTGRYKQSAENKMELLSVEIPAAVGGTSNDATSEAGASFSGKVSKVDPEAKTIVIDNKTYYVLPTTQIKRSDSMANFTDIKPGSQLSGRYKQSAENKMEVLSLEIPQSIGGTSNDATSESGASFSGKVSRVDPAAQTVVIDHKTYHVLPTTRITRNDKQASFNSIKAGTQVNGRYKQSIENNMELLSLDIAQAAGGTRDSSTSQSGNNSIQSGNNFSGKVTKVDQTTQRVTIGNRTYQVLPTTTVTLPNGKQTTVANLKPNQQVSGTYKQSTDGNYEILSMHVVANSSNSSRPE